MKFEIVGDIGQVETIASGRGVEIRLHLQKAYGKGRWRKHEGVATVRLPDQRPAGHLRIQSSYAGNVFIAAVGTRVA